MAKGLLKHQERQSALSLLGKNLARRARSKCELCEASGVPLKIYEVPPIPSEPDFEHCLMTCDNCREQLDNPKRMHPDHWRCLTKTIWSDVPVIQALSLRLLRKLAEQYQWAADTLEIAYLTPEVEEWAGLA